MDELIAQELARVLRDYAQPAPELGWEGIPLLVNNAEEAADYIIEHTTLGITLV